VTVVSVTHVLNLSVYVGFIYAEGTTAVHGIIMPQVTLKGLSLCATWLTFAPSENISRCHRDDTCTLPIEEWQCSESQLTSVVQPTVCVCVCVLCAGNSGTQ